MNTQIPTIEDVKNGFVAPETVRTILDDVDVSVKTFPVGAPADEVVEFILKLTEARLGGELRHLPSQYQELFTRRLTRACAVISLCALFSYIHQESFSGGAFTSPPTVRPKWFNGEGNPSGVLFQRAHAEHGSNDAASYLTRALLAFIKEDFALASNIIYRLCSNFASDYSGSLCGLLARLATASDSLLLSTLRTFSPRLPNVEGAVFSLFEYVPVPKDIDDLSRLPPLSAVNELRDRMQRVTMAIGEEHWCLNGLRLCASSDETLVLCPSHIASHDAGGRFYYSPAAQPYPAQGVAAAIEYVSRGSDVMFLRGPREDARPMSKAILSSNDGTTPDGGYASGQASASPLSAPCLRDSNAIPSSETFGLARPLKVRSQCVDGEPVALLGSRGEDTNQYTVTNLEVVYGSIGYSGLKEWRHMASQGDSYFDNGYFLHFSGQVFPGHCGSPVIGSDGAVLGIITGGSYASKGEKCGAYITPIQTIIDHYAKLQSGRFSDAWPDRHRGSTTFTWVIEDCERNDRPVISGDEVNVRRNYERLRLYVLDLLERIG